MDSLLGLCVLNHLRTAELPGRIHCLLIIIIKLFISSKQYKSALRMNGVNGRGEIEVTKDHNLFYISQGNVQAR